MLGYCNSLYTSYKLLFQNFKSQQDEQPKYSCERPSCCSQTGNKVKNQNSTAQFEAIA